MAKRRSMPSIAGLLLSLPLIAIATWFVYGGLHPGTGPTQGRPTLPPAAAKRSEAIVAGFPDPEVVLPADRLHERVDGAEDYLRAHGCVKLLAWRLGDVQADLEVLVFNDAQGAGKVLARDVGPQRTTGPGEEASVDAQGILFRRGRIYARLTADPGSSTPPERLLEVAARLDRALIGGAEKGL
jgi:hypothetical protein